MKIIDTTEKIFASFDGMHFDLEKWGTYMDAAIPHAKQLCLDDLRSSAEAVAGGFERFCGGSA